MNYIVELKAESGECADVLPPTGSYSARSSVYEYGGAPYGVLGGGHLIFSNRGDNSVNILDADKRSVKQLLQSPTLRYGDFDAFPGSDDSGPRWVLAVEEDHAIKIPEKVKNYVVAIDTQSGEVNRLASGADLYMFPRFSLDGTKICWVEWDFPDMPWTGVRLFWADWDGKTGTITGIEHIAGDSSASVTEPQWGSDGYLYFCHERTDWRQLYRRKPGQDEASLIKVTGLEDVEFGRARMGLGW